MQIELPDYDPKALQELHGVSIQRGRRFVLNLSRWHNFPYERFLQADYWARHEKLLVAGDIVIVITPSYVLELEIGERDEDGELTVRMITGSFSMVTS